MDKPVKVKRVEEYEQDLDDIMLGCSKAVKKWMLDPDAKEGHNQGIAYNLYITLSGENGLFRYYVYETPTLYVVEFLGTT